MTAGTAALTVCLCQVSASAARRIRAVTAAACMQQSYVAWICGGLLLQCQWALLIAMFAAGHGSCHTLTMR